MDLVFKRPFNGRRRAAMARRCIAMLLLSISPMLPSKVCGQLLIEPSAESRSAWRYNFSEADVSLLDEIQRGCFKYFWNEVGRPAMLAKDKASDSICSIAAVGFQLSSLPIGVKRGWITRAEGEERAITVLRALLGRTDNKKFGIYLHYLDSDS